MQDPQQTVESARYALLRRLAYAMRHHMVVHLQPIGMIMEVMERRLAAPAPDLAQIHDSMGKMHTHARAAVQSSLDIVTWLAPEDGKLVPLDAGVLECFDLLRSYLNFRGFALANEVKGLPQPVLRSALRTSLSAALLALADHAGSPAEIVMRAQAGEKGVTLTIDVQPGQGSPGFAGEPHYRLIEWSDVEAIATAEGVVLTHAAHPVSLAFAA